MLNSCLSVSLVSRTCRVLTDLLNGHHYLHGIKTVQAEIVVEVRFAVELECFRHCSYRAKRSDIP